MNIKDLQSGMIVETAKGLQFLVTVITGSSLVLFTSNNGGLCDSVSDFDENLLSLSSKFSDIVKVYRITALVDGSNSINSLPKILIWERPTIEVTVEDIAKKFNTSIKYLKIII